jgi:putative peptidoglycan lipid II flippase
MHLLRSVTTIAGFTAISRVLGFARDILIASFLGAGPIADAFFVAFKFPNFFRRLFAEGAFNAAFVPLFTRLHTSEGLEKATRNAEQIIAVLSLTLVGLVVAVELTLPWLMCIIAPGFEETPERLQYAIDFTRITFPYILFISLSACLGGILNSIGHFSSAAAAPILLNISMMTSMLAFNKSFPTTGHALVWGVMVAGIGQYLWLYYSAYAHGVRFKWVWPKLTPIVRKLLKTMVPGAISAGVVQINLFIDIMIASFLPTGAVSFLFFADRLNQFPLSLIGIAMSTALLPLTAKHFQKGEMEAAIYTQNRALEYSLILTLPAATALIVLAYPIISVLFERNHFGAYEAFETAKVLAAFAIGLPAYILIKVLSTVFFAKLDTKTPLKAALLSLVTNIICNFILIAPLKHVGIALSTALAAWVNVAYLLRVLTKERLLKFDERLKTRLPRIIFATLLMGTFIEILDWSFKYYSYNAYKALSLIIMILLGGASYSIAALFSKAFRLQDVRKYLVRKNP